MLVDSRCANHHSGLFASPAEPLVLLVHFRVKSLVLSEASIVYVEVSAGELGYTTRSKLYTPCSRSNPTFPTTALVSPANIFMYIQYLYSTMYFIF